MAELAEKGEGVVMEVLGYSEYAHLSQIDPSFPTSVIVPAGVPIELEERDTAFGFVWNGVGRIASTSFAQEIREGMFFSLSGPLVVTMLSGMVCIRHGYRGLATWGGPIERLGRLKYIDGCSDTLLVPPPVKGDACLNYLYIPPHVDQTPHIHPSTRVGCIVEGSGRCRLNDSTVNLHAGMVFVLAGHELHSFHTEGQALRLVVYHPDSDFGPTDEVHPMINRTLIDGEPIMGSS